MLCCKVYTYYIFNVNTTCGTASETDKEHANFGSNVFNGASTQIGEILHLVSH